jgi:DNA-binding response OmpR family regulator
MSKLMIIDDDQNTVSLLKILFEMDGFEVASFTDRKNILDDIRATSPDLVLMDVFIFNQDGTELLKEMRSSTDLTDVRVVMSSGMDLTEKCIAAGADAFLLKPYTPEMLMNVIKNTLAIERNNNGKKL